MKIFSLLVLAVIFFTSCNNSGKGKSFCDTTCSSNPVSFRGGPEFEQSATITIKDCEPDSIIWTHNKLYANRQIWFRQYFSKTVRVNKSAVDIAFQDTSYVWITLNDCLTGRGYMLKLPFRKGNDITTTTAALTRFDPKFSLDPDLRAYTDRGNIYVANVVTGKLAQMTFKKEYEMDMDNIHKAIDTINITKQRIYVKLLDKDGKEVPLEKKD